MACCVDCRGRAAILAFKDGPSAADGEEFLALAADLPAGGVGEIRIDLSNVPRFDGRDLGFLLGLKKKAEEMGLSVVLAAPRDEARALMDIARIAYEKAA